MLLKRNQFFCHEIASKANRSFTVLLDAQFLSRSELSSILYTKFIFYHLTLILWDPMKWIFITCFQPFGSLLLNTKAIINFASHQQKRGKRANSLIFPSVSYHFNAAKIAYSLDNSQIMGLFAEENVRPFNYVREKEKWRRQEALSLSH